MDSCLALFALMVTSLIGELRKDLPRHLCRVASNREGDLFCQPVVVWIDVDLNNLRVPWPVIHSIAGQVEKGLSRVPNARTMSACAMISIAAREPL